MEGDPNSKPFSSSSSFASFSPPSTFYDVFLSSNEDSGANFKEHLCDVLSSKGIPTIYVEDVALKRGKDIGPELTKVIQDSEYAVVVLSESYATSSWCLQELAQIVECMGDSGRIQTIFYRVNPSHVRNLKSKNERKLHESRFWKALEEHAMNPDHSKYVETWRDALVEVTYRPGYVVVDETDEAKFINDFVEELSTKLRTGIKNLEGPFGMSRLLKKLESYIDQSSSDVHFIGVHGMGGIGKSTLAKAYFKMVSHKFDGGNCYLQNIREVCEKKENGLEHLQTLLLSDILGGPFGDIKDVDCGTDMIRRRLRNKKVLIVLDDVNEANQLKALGVEDKLFGSGSVIIMTTRNASLFNKSYCTTYVVEQLDDVEALQLFSSKAFRSIDPPEKFKELSKQVVKCCENLPLALTILGSLLSHEKSVDEWKDALSRLRQCPENKIVEKLKISFDDLDEEDKCIFLDIACFFKGHDINDVIRILDTHGLSSEYGIRNLTKRALLEIQHGRKLWMNDFIQKMGHEIAQQGSDKSGRPSRLWDVNEFKDILERTRGAIDVEAIVVSFQKENRMLCFRGLSKMERLRLLMVLGAFNFQAESGDLTVPQLNYLSNDLYLLEWHRFPFKQFPSSFEPYKLVELKLIESNLRQLWDNFVKLPNLKVINLRDSRHFTTFGDFSMAPNLESLILEGCTQLLEIHPTITVLYRLIVLDLKFCTSLEKLPSNIKGLNSLKQFNLYGCRKLCKLPEDIGDLHSLEKLDMRETSIKHLPSSISLIRNLEPLMNIEVELVHLSETLKLYEKHYDVFLSFSTRNINFASHLYQALHQNGIRTFFYDDETGNEVSPVLLLNAVEESSYSVIGLSEKYASSSRCLTELAKIVECMQTRNQTVIPIFYYVDPSRDLPNGIGSYRDAFKYHEINHSDKVDSWRDAFTVIANLPAWTLREMDIEQHFIEDFVEHLLVVLDNKQPNVFMDDIFSSLADLGKIDESNPPIGKESGESTAFTSVGRHFQEHYGAAKSFDIVAPGSEIPPWFMNRSLGGSINLKLNPNWCNHSWMGLALIVCFRANPSNVLYCDMKLDSTLWKVRTMDCDSATMGNSNQIWLFFYPRHKWPTEKVLNSCVSLDFSFRPTVPFCDNYGPCGVRLVYKEDIEELNKFNINYFNQSRKRKAQPSSFWKGDYKADSHFKDRLGFQRRSF